MTPRIEALDSPDRADPGDGRPHLSGSRRALVERLKRAPARTAGELAEDLDLTGAAVRQHLGALESDGLARRELAPSGGRGRPPERWSLTEAAAALFPDRHGDLSVELLVAIRSALGEAGLQRVIEARGTTQLTAYRAAVDPAHELVDQVRELARQRAAEGYLAEAIVDDEGCLLIEHHCPIADAARSCVGLCQAELDLFRETLGPEVAVERVEHLLTADARCAYRIRPAGSAPT